MQPYQDEIGNLLQQEILNNITFRDIPLPSLDFRRKSYNYTRDYFLLAHLLGFAHSLDIIEIQKTEAIEGANFKYDFTPVDDLEALIERAGKGESFIAEVEDMIDEKIKHIVLLEYYDSMERLRGIIEKNIKEGQSITEFIQAVGADNLMKKIGIAENSAWYLNNVYRTNLFLAHNNGKWKSGMENSSVVKFQYMAVEDQRTTTICEDLNGTVRDKNDHFWLTYTPPNHFQCRSELIEITKSLADVLNIKDVEKIPSEKALNEVGPEFLNDQVNSNSWMQPTIDMKKRLNQFINTDLDTIPF